jgi:acylphosphatase
VSTPERIARQVVVHGQVQGVFFRDSCFREAEAVDVTGWVSNEPDGTVHAYFEGPPAGVEKMVAWMHDGPRKAVVERVDVADSEPSGSVEFRVR